jgi:hypothetical protein
VVKRYAGLHRNGVEIRIKSRMITKLKTRTGLLAAELLIKKKSDAKVLISVPTEILKEQ